MTWLTIRHIPQLQRRREPWGLIRRIIHSGVGKGIWKSLMSSKFDLMNEWLIGGNDILYWFDLRIPFYFRFNLSSQSIIPGNE
mmetsp:Transcript_50637/g.57332  ORF Transcript_50637/g.57332 Transcript_50637/m.57332 type:complete len:83 (+) Transcript_50637:1823-2071(+)